MTGAGSGGGGGYDYVEASYPSGADEGESLYHLTENAAFVYSGTEWIEQTVTDHSQLSGVNEGDHRSDQRVSDLAPVQTRYADSEARTAVDGSNVSVGYADDAGELGGSPPSAYETPAETAGVDVTNNGWITIHDTSYPYDWTSEKLGYYADGARITVTPDSQDRIDFSIRFYHGIFDEPDKILGDSSSDIGAEAPETYTYNFDASEVEVADISMSYADSYEVELHIVPTTPHVHQI